VDVEFLQTVGLYNSASGGSQRTVVDAGHVGELSEHGRAKPASAEGKPEEDGRDGADPASYKLLREHDDG
jgi:hypothetical protein